MSVKVFPLHRCFTTIFLICLLGHIQISNTVMSCQYQKENQTGFFIKWCPDICCSITPRQENTTCCNTPSVYISDITTTTSTFTIFGYTWWRIFLISICLMTAISILIHYLKRIHLFKHKNHFNSIVDPIPAFTISKEKLNIIYNDKAIALEGNPPSYSTSVSPSPPPYVSINPSTIKYLE